MRREIPVSKWNRIVVRTMCALMCGATLTFTGLGGACFAEPAPPFDLGPDEPAFVAGGNVARITQTGSSQTGVVGQTGSSNAAHVVQAGGTNAASILQAGAQNA